MRPLLLLSFMAAGLAGQTGDKLAVLTFDDAVKSHLTVVAPLLKELGFSATFFVTHQWMNDKQNFLTWAEIAELHRMGFEIGNHTWTHPNLSQPRSAARLPAELALVENELRKAGVPRPISFAYSGNGFGPEAVEQLSSLGYKFARRGMQPEVPYGQIEPGVAYDPLKHHPLLIPTTADAYPKWTLEHFRKVLSRAAPGKVVVLQFHGVPDVAHPWVHTPPDKFRDYMLELKQAGFRVIAMRDLERYVDLRKPPPDPTLKVRFPERKDGRLLFPVEMEETRADLPFWLRNMLQYHGYSAEETSLVTGLSVEEIKKAASGLKSIPAPRVEPYPGGRHPRIGFLEGAISPMRGTKASVFLPWAPSDYVVVDLPEAIFSNLGLLFLAHTHIPTYWDDQNVVIENVDWTRNSDGSLTLSRELPNKVRFGASIRPAANGAEMELWLENGTGAALRGLRTQVCAMLKGAREFNRQATDNKLFQSPVAAVKSESGRRWILIAWDRGGRAWGNVNVPCLHVDPVLPDCPPGERVQVRGQLWFYEGNQVEAQMKQAAQEFRAAEAAR